MRRSTMDGLVQGVLVLALSATVATGLRLGAVEAMTVSSTSMSPTVLPGEVVLVEKWDRAVQRGDLVVFRLPQEDAATLKRVVGGAGDVVEIRDGLLFVDGRAVHEPYVDQETVDGVHYGPVTVPEGSIHVLGDARRGSVDSRIFGSVLREDVIGQVRLALWPPGRLERTSEWDPGPDR